MAKITLTRLENLENEVSAVAAINANNDRIVEAIEKTVFRDGESPNNMLDELDMDSKKIINLPKATSPTEPIRKQEFDQATFAALGLTEDDVGVVVFDGANATTRVLQGQNGVEVLNPAGQFNDPYIGLDEATRASLALADTATQPGDLGDLAVKDKVTVADIDATGTPSSTTYLGGNGVWSVPPATVPDGSVTPAKLSSVLYKRIGVIATPGAAADAPMAAAIAEAVAQNAILFIPAGTYYFTKEVNLSPLLTGTVAKIELGGNVTFDFTGATSLTDFPDAAFVYISGGANLEWIGLNNQANKGDAQIVIANPVGPILPNDRYVIYDATNVWNGARSYYLKGEFIRVAKVNGSTLTLFGALYDTYAAGSVVIYKVPNKSITITGGKIFIQEPTASIWEETASLFTDKIVDSDFSMFVPLDAPRAGQVHRQAIGLHGTGYKIIQKRVSASQDCYGIVISNCQDCFIQGDFNATKHAIAIGGDAAVGAVTNRNVRAYGTFTNPGTAQSGQYAANMHGNAEFCHIEGFINGGVSIGGDNNSVRGTIITRPEMNGVAVLFVEMLGFNFDFSGVNIKAYGTPQSISLATIDCGGSGSYGPDANTTRGGVMKFDGMNMECALSSRPLAIQNNGFTNAEKVTISLKNARIKAGLAGSPTIVMAVNTGRTLDELHLHGFANEKLATYSLAGVSKVKGWTAAGTLTATPVVGNAVATTAVSWIAPRTPAVVVQPIAVITAGGLPIKGFYSGASTAVANIGFSTLDGSAFTSTTAANVAWWAFVEE